MIFSDTSGNPRRIQLKKKVVKFFLSSLLVFTVVFSVASYYFYNRYFEISHEVVELDMLQKENQYQQVQLHKFAKKIQEFEAQMVRMEKFDRKLRIITALDVPEGYQNGKMGLGGSSQNLMGSSTYDSSDIVTHSLSDRISEDLKNLKVRSELQEISFLELDEFFKNQSSLFSSTPSIWPARGWVTSAFGYRRSPFTNMRELHEGVDIATRAGSPIVATANGVVIRSGRDNSYGKMVEVDHGYGIITRYGHNSKNLVKTGDRVKRGEVIALVGNTGRSTGPHSHYEVILNGVPVNPLRYILEEGTGTF